jgi:hypothetical protein
MKTDRNATEACSSATICRLPAEIQIQKHLAKQKNKMYFTKFIKSNLHPKHMAMVFSYIQRTASQLTRGGNNSSGFTSLATDSKAKRNMVA